MRKIYTEFSIKLYKPFFVRRLPCRGLTCRSCFTDNNNKVSIPSELLNDTRLEREREREREPGHMFAFRGFV